MLVFQDEESMADLGGRKKYDYQHYQTTIREIELATGLKFDDQIFEKNPLFFNESDEAKKLKVTSFPERVDVNGPEDLIGKGDERTPARDDDINVYLAGAHIAPTPGSNQKEWVSILNMEPARWT